MRVIFLIMIGLSVSAWAGLSKSGNIVSDSTTALQWQDNEVGSEMTWEDAITHCEDLVLDGHSDWRLPNLKELTSLVDDSRVSPSIDTSVFEYTTSNLYWSSTTYAGNASLAWSVHFSSGSQYYSNKGNNPYVRCVRAGQ